MKVSDMTVEEFERSIETITEIYSYAQELAIDKGFENLTDSDIEKIIHESRGLC
ncbi:hypothetical protein [Candidatus Magnetobacterium casense]|uniref:hypothetical protein n=1 Tax=Candidatus Magnetobacterium casense TaxID=1455061 RepID=UPI0012DF9E8C|nr:hypothetical protein [Candidatus Magnetobacterium casensis]